MTTRRDGPENSGLELALEPRSRRPVLWITALTLLIFFLWAANAPIEESTRGPGKVAPLSRGQIIQSLEGGILNSLAVREGEEVAAGQTLATMDDTPFRTAFQDLEGRTVALRAASNRLHAELNGAERIEFDAGLAAFGRVAQTERQLFQARRRTLRETTASLRERIELAERELNLIRPLVQRGAASAVEQLRLERSLTDLRGELTGVRNTYLQQVNDEIARTDTELASLTQQLEQKRDALERTVLHSPVRGIVKNLRVTTRGGVVGPGETIMEIVPLDEQLYVEARIRPQDVAFLRPGLPATVRITAYDYAIYGALNGKLVFVSADTFQDDGRREIEPYYRVRVRTDSATLQGPEGPLPIKPGMVAEVNIRTGERTVLQYLLKPLLRGQPLSER